MATRKLEYISQKQKDIVTGYIRQSQSLFPPENSYFNIVDLIKYLILAFYAVSFESNILNDEEQDAFLSFLSANKKPIADHLWKLIYQSSKDGFSKANFVEKGLHFALSVLR